MTGFEAMSQAAARMGVPLDSGGWWEAERLDTTTGYVRGAEVRMLVERPGWAAWAFTNKAGEPRAVQASVAASHIGSRRFRVLLSSVRMESLEDFWRRDNGGAEAPASAAPKPRPELRALWLVKDMMKSPNSMSTFLLALAGPAGTMLSMAWECEYNDTDAAGVRSKERVLAQIRDRLATSDAHRGRIGRWPESVRYNKPTLADAAALMDGGRARFGQRQAGSGEPREYALADTLMAPDDKLAALLRRRLAKSKLRNL